MSLLTLFVNNLLPILLLAGAGFAVGTVFEMDPRPLGRVIFYVFSPLLIFKLITQSELPFEQIGWMVGFALAVMACMAGLAFILGKLARFSRPTLAAVLLTTMVGNNGNYGLPVIAFAFGETALAYASIYFVTSTIVVYTAGVAIASLGRMNMRQALSNLLKVPSVYAIILAMFFARWNLALPEFLERTVNLGAGGTIPAMLILLGMELQRAVRPAQPVALGIPLISRLVLGPILAWGLALQFPLPLPAQQAGIAESGMPTAVLTTVLASEYRLDSSLVSSIVFITTLLSPLTLTPVLYFLGS